MLVTEIDDAESSTVPIWWNVEDAYDTYHWVCSFEVKR